MPKNERGAWLLSFCIIITEWRWRRARCGRFFVILAFFVILLVAISNRVKLKITERKVVVVKILGVEG